MDLVKFFRPKILIGGGSAYPRHWDYKKLREAANVNESILLFDMAHIAGLIAAGEAPSYGLPFPSKLDLTDTSSSPFDYADIVTTTTHKTLRGPRGGLIFFRKGLKSVDKKSGKGSFFSPIHFSKSLTNKYFRN